MHDEAPAESPTVNRRRLLAAVAVLGGLPGCQSLGATPDRESPGQAGTTDTPIPDGGTEIRRLAMDTARADPQVSDDTVEKLVADNTAFALDLVAELQGQRDEANLFSSPYSVSVALAMTYAGARGQTAEGMRSALRLSLPDEDLHPAFNRLTTLIEQDHDESDDGDPFTLRVVNAIWGQHGFPFADAYLELLATHYGAGLNTVDFAEHPEEARAAINAWVADQTEGKIEELLGRDAVGPRTRLVLTNAIYFLGSWASPFDPDNTEDRSFHGINGTTSQVPMMHKTAELPYTTRDGHQAVELPYVGKSASMLVILPADGQFREFLRSLDRDQLSDFIDSLERAKGSLGLPKFTYESSFNLSSVLSDMGMAQAFEPGGADFSRMYEPGAASQELFIQDVVHKGYVAVDEAGTEAAAATGVSVGVISVGPEEQWEMVVDRPFVFLIRDRDTDTVVFLGTVVDAEQFQ